MVFFGERFRTNITCKWFDSWMKTLMQLQYNRLNSVHVNNIIWEFELPSYCFGQQMIWGKYYTDMVFRRCNNNGKQKYA